MHRAMPDVENIPRGNTCPGVNRAIIEYLLSRGIGLEDKAVLDVPCGSGEFLDTIIEFFPGTRTTGADMRPPAEFAHEFFRLDAREEFGSQALEKFDLVTVISGVMEFDNTLGFFRSIRRVANDNVMIIITNDNLVTVRDRILFLLFGRFGQYKTLPGKRGSTWKILHLADLERILFEAGFRVREVRYVVGSRTAWLWLPLAIPIYLLQLAYLLMAERSMKSADKKRYFPFASTVARHYLLVCEKDSKVDADADVDRLSGMR